MRARLSLGSCAACAVAAFAAACGGPRATRLDALGVAPSASAIVTATASSAEAAPVPVVDGSSLDELASRFEAPMRTRAFVEKWRAPMELGKGLPGCCA